LINKCNSIKFIKIQEAIIMKKLCALFSISLLFVLILVSMLGCQGQPSKIPELVPPTQSPEPVPKSKPSTPIEQAPRLTTPLSPTEPSVEPPPASGETIPKSLSEPTIPEPLTHSSAYLKFDGINGESKSLGHEGWSEIVSFSQAIHKPGSSIDTTRRRGDIIFEDIVIVRQIDKASPKLAESICTGKVFPKVEIHLTGPSKGSACQGIFYRYELKNVMITSYKVSGSNPLAYALVAPAPDSILPYSGPFIVQAVDAPMEELSINYEEIKVTYTECDSTGKAKGNVEYNWKVEEGELS
jgi:type VI secretion system secreted protein Hcp